MFGHLTIRSGRLVGFKIPSGKRLHNYGKPPFSMEKSTISMAIFNSFLYVYQRVSRMFKVSGFESHLRNGLAKPPGIMGSCSSRSMEVHRATTEYLSTTGFSSERLCEIGINPSISKFSLWKIHCFRLRNSHFSR